MSDFRLRKKGFAELRRAVQRNPRAVKREVGVFLSRGIAVLNRQVIRNPWRMGAGGGGAPVDTGNLRDTHRREINQWNARIYPTAPYAPYVHGIEGFPRKRSYQLRPWLDYATEKGEPEVRQLERRLLKNIVGDLAR